MVLLSLTTFTNSGLLCGKGRQYFSSIDLSYTLICFAADASKFRSHHCCPSGVPDTNWPHEQRCDHVLAEENTKLYYKWSVIEHTVLCTVIQYVKYYFNGKKLTVYWCFLQCLLLPCGLRFVARNLCICTSGVYLQGQQILTFPHSQAYSRLMCACTFNY